MLQKFLIDCGRIAAPAHAGNGGHSRVVPAVDKVFLDELQEFAFAHHGIGEIQAGKFDLLRVVDAELVEEPVVERPVVFKFEGADGVGDSFDGVLQAVRPVVHRVDAPIVAGAVMGGVQDAVHNRVAHIEIGMGHIDFSPQCSRAVGEFACPHTLKEVEVFLDGAVAVRAVFAGLGERAAIIADLVCVKVADIGLAYLYKLDGVFVHLLESNRRRNRACPPSPSRASGHRR